MATQPVTRKPKVFIGSSVEGLPVAQHLQATLDYEVESTVWNQGVFDLSIGGLESLARKLKDFDFAILVLTPDDLVTKREVTSDSPRDNVLLELGLFMGALGRERTFIVYCRDEHLSLPSDLNGVTPATYANRSDGNLRAAVGSAARDILDAIQRVVDSQGTSPTSVPQMARPPAPVLWRLVPGCNNVVAVANETVQQVAARVGPRAAVVSIWKMVPGTSQYLVAVMDGSAPPTVSNLATVNAFDAIFICVSAAATYRLAGVYDIEPPADEAPSPAPPGPVVGPGGPGLRFYGVVRVHGATAPAGARISAVLGSTVCGTALTSESGTYVMDIVSASAQSGGWEPGATITFYVGNAVAMSATHWLRGQAINLDLAV